MRSWKEFLRSDPEERGKVERLAHLLDSLATELYFASGAGDRRSASDDDGHFSDEVRRRFYRELGPVIDRLAEVGLPSVAHHLVQTLGAMVPVDPTGVFRRLAAIVQSSEAYRHESLAAERIVGLVRRYLAEYRPLLQEDSGCRNALMQVLDAFAYWPEAGRLVLNLEDIWR